MAVRQFEQAEEMKDGMFSEHNLRMSGMSRAEVEAMLRTFLKRMANMKLMVPFTTWLDLVGGRKGNRFKDQVSLLPQCHTQCVICLATLYLYPCV